MYHLTQNDKGELNRLWVNFALFSKIKVSNISIFNIMNNKTVYVITTGEYSDYSICAIFSTKEKANEYIQQHGTEYRIEEYNLDEEVVKEVQLWRIDVSLKDNSLVEVSALGYRDKDYQDKCRDTCSVYETFRDGNCIKFFVDADSMDKAIKIVSERFAAIKANEYILLRLTRPYGIGAYGHEYETFNVKTNKFTKL